MRIMGKGWRGGERNGGDQRKMYNSRKSIKKKSRHLNLVEFYDENDKLSIMYFITLIDKLLFITIQFTEDKIKINYEMIEFQA